MPATRSISRFAAARVAAAVGLAALATACAAAPAPTEQELAMIDDATTTLLPATPTERALADQQDMLTQAKFWAAEYEKNPNEYEAALRYARVLRSIGSGPRAAEVSAQALSMKPGDVVEVEIEGVGVLRNKVVAG